MSMAFVSRNLVGQLRKSLQFAQEWRPQTVALIDRKYGQTSTPASNSQVKPATNLLHISDSCALRLKEICTENNLLRVTVDNGGCSGFQYKFDLDTTINEDDIQFGPENKVIIDTISLEYCAGATLDFHSELIRSGFRIISNPKAEQGCSCGASFALRLD